MAVLEDVKTAMRIRHDALDDLLSKQIATARAEMVRAGVPQAVAQDDDNYCVTDAVITFCQMRNADSMNDADKYTESWKYQLDCLRKSTMGMVGGD